MKREIIGIYLIKNKINNKLYVGQSTNVKRRWKRHITTVKNKNYPIYNSINKYGIENFDFSILEECEIVELDEREISWIQELKTMVPNGYNLTSGGGQGHFRSEETKEKIREALSGENNPMYGKIFSEQHRERLSLSSKNKIVSEETKRKQSISLSGENNPMYGKTLSEETKKKISEALSGGNNGFYGRTHSEETKKKSGRSKMKGRKIGCDNGKTYLSIYEANIDTNTTSHGICDVLHERKKTTKGLVFWYE
ncbi:MAG: NUMOD3 domain-containing DNA-binding protein [Melioribacteraceae bacterium]